MFSTLGDTICIGNLGTEPKKLIFYHIAPDFCHMLRRGGGGELRYIKTRNFIP